MLQPAIRTLYLNQFFTDYPFPEFKFVYCSSLMIRQIENAFANKEVSFSHEVKNIDAILNNEGTIIKYNHNFNNISFFHKGGSN